MLKFSAGYMKAVLILVSIIVVGGCAESRLPLGKGGLQEYLYKVADVGYEFDYEIIDYSKREVSWWESKREGDRKGVKESFTLQLRKEDHKKILETVEDRSGWVRVDVTLKPLGVHPRYYAFRNSVAFYNERMWCESTIFEEKQIIEIYCSEIHF